MIGRQWGPIGASDGAVELETLSPVTSIAMW
jgi:hypothetical protein